VVKFQTIRNVSKSFQKFTNLNWFEFKFISDDKIKIKKITFEKTFPSLTNGTEGKLLKGFIPKYPFFWVNKLLIINNKSLVVFTGKKRFLGTFIPIAPLKLFIAAPEAVSS